MFFNDETVQAYILHANNERMTAFLNHELGANFKADVSPLPVKTKGRKLSKLSMDKVHVAFDVGLNNTLNRHNNPEIAKKNEYDVDYKLQLFTSTLLRSKLDEKGSLLIYDDFNEDNVKSFLSLTKDNREKVFLLQQTPFFHGENNKWLGHFAFYFYPDDETIHYLRQVFSLNAVTKESIKVLDKDSVVGVFGLLFGLSQEDIVKNFKKADYFVMLFFTVVIPSNKHQMGAPVVLDLNPVLGFNSWRQAPDSDYAKVLKSIKEGLAKEIDFSQMENPNALDDMAEKQTYLTWELECMSTCANDLRFLKEAYNFPIEDDLIKAMVLQEQEFDKLVNNYS